MAALGGLLGDYGSDGSSDSQRDSGGVEAVTREEKPVDSTQGPPEPQPSLLHSLPPPKAQVAARSVGFVLPIDVAALARGDSSEEDEPAIEKPGKMPNQGMSKLLEFLPAPKNVFHRKEREVGKMKSSTAKDVSNAVGQHAPSTTPEIPSNEAYRLDKPGAEVDGDLGNELYRVGPLEGGPAGVSGIHSFGGDPSGIHLASSAGNEDAAVTISAFEGVDQGSRKRPFEDLGMDFKEIRQEELVSGGSTTVDPVKRVGEALGSEYASSLLGQAAPFKGSKLAKRKHQIGTLYHDMKMNELKSMASKAQGVKSKHETESKYGWR